MRLNHLDLPVPDVAQTRHFFETWFGFRHQRTVGRAGAGHDGLSILTDDDGLVLVLSRRPRRGPQGFPATFHIGFHLDSAEAVDALYRRLNAAGLAHEPPARQHGAFACYLTAPGGILVEIAYRPAQPTAATIPAKSGTT